MTKNQKAMAVVSLQAAAAPLVQIRAGELVTDSLAIARVLARRHDNVLQSLDKLLAKGVFNRLDFKVVKRRDRKGELRRSIELSERAALIAAPFIGGKQATLLQVKIVDAFMSMRETMQRDTDAWQKLRYAASHASQLMNEALFKTRAKDGKVTRHVHYVNETKLINAVVFGQREGVVRDQLTVAELCCLEQMLTRNAVLIATGAPYKERETFLKGAMTSLAAGRPGVC